MTDFVALSAPFPPDRVSWRVGSTTKDKSRGLALAFIDARDVYDRLDAVAGPANWQLRYTHADKKTVCEIGLRIGEEWVWKANGAGDSDVEAEKGALSDAAKRAAVLWGIGRYLYDLESPWVELEPKGQSYIIKPSEMGKLRTLLSRNAGHAPAAKVAPDDQEAKMVAAVRAVENLERLEKLTSQGSWQKAMTALPNDAAARVATVATERAQALTVAS